MSKKIENDYDYYLKEPTANASARTLAPWLLQAMDSTTYLLDALEAKSGNARELQLKSTIRDAAIKALMHWLSGHPDRQALLFEEISGKTTFTQEAKNALRVLLSTLGDPKFDDTIPRLTNFLKSDDLLVRELGKVQLTKLDPGAAKEAPFDANATQGTRDSQLKTWLATIDRRKAKAK